MKVIKNIFLSLGIMLSALLVIGLMLPEPSSQRGQVASVSSNNATQDMACQHPAAPPSGHFGASDLAAISEASSGNEARFDRDYKSRVFYDCLYFESLERALFGPGWDLRLKSTSGRWLADVSCKVTDADARSLVNVSEGEMLHIQGVIKTTAIGTVLLEKCRVS